MFLFKETLLKSIFFITACVLSTTLYAGAKENSADTKLPTPSALFAKHVSAIGGEKTLKNHTKRTVNGKLIIQAMGIHGRLHVAAAAPNKLVTTIDLGQFGVSRSGFNGEIGWSMDAMSGNQILQGEALQAMIARADIYADSLNLGKDTKQKKTVDVTKFDGGEHYRVQLVDKKGEESYLYFSKDTGLMSGVDRMELGPMGKMPTQIRLRDYVDFNGIRSARKISSSQNGVETIMEIDSVSYEEHAKDIFDLPAEIKALVKP